MQQDTVIPFPHPGLDHRIGHPTPCEPISLLAVEDSGALGGLRRTPVSWHTLTGASAQKIALPRSSRQDA